MKKGIIGIFAVIIIAYVFQLNSSVFYGEALNSGFVFDSSKLIKQMNEATTGSVMTETFEKGDPIYTRLDDVIIGENDFEVIGTSIFPLFLENGKIISFLNDSSSLINESFSEIKTSKESLLSQGTLFDKFGNSKSIDQYILAKLSNGLYINSLEISFNYDDKLYTIPSNSIIQFKESEIKYYSYKDDRLFLNSIINIIGSSNIQVGNLSLNYIEFLSKIGVYNAPSKSNNIIKKNTNENNKNGELNGNKDLSNGISGNNNDIQNGNSKPGFINSNSSGFGEESDVNKNYISPIVNIGKMNVNYYSVDTSIMIEDIQKNIDRNVFISVKKGKELILNIPINKTGPIQIKGLEPGTEYSIQVNYKYKDKKGDIVEFFFPIEKIVTKSITTLEEINLSYNIDGIYANKMTLNNFKTTTMLPNDVINNVSKVLINFNDTISYVVPQNLVPSFLNTKEINFSTSDILNSNTIYDVRVEVLDIFGNKLNLLDHSVSNHYYRTAKNVPSVRAQNVVGNFNSIDFSYILNNKDNANINSLSYKLLLNGDIIQENNIPLDTEKITINNVISKTNYQVDIYGNYDINNGQGYITSKLGQFSTVSAPLDVLGKVSINGNFVNRTSSSLRFDYNLSTSITNAELIKLISKVQVSLIDKNNDNVVKDILLEGSELQAFKEGKTLSIEDSDLKPDNLYSINIVPIVVDSLKETNIDVKYIQSNNQYTFKLEPYVTFKGHIFYEGSYYLDLAIIDQYKTIVDNNYTINLIDVNTKDVIESFKGNQLSDIKLEYSILDTTIDYGVEVIADEFNIGQGTGTLELNKQIGKIQRLKDNNPLTGNVYLKTLNINDQIATANINLSVDNTAGFITNDTAYISIKDGSTIVDTKQVNLKSNEITTINNIYNLEVNKDYNVELYTQIGSETFLLSTDIFNTSKNVYPISNEDELYAINNDLNANYSVINDISLERSERISGAFNGNVDFNGHQLSLSLIGRQYLFEEIGSNGSINNIKYILTKVEDRGPSSLVNINNGNISNVIGVNEFAVSKDWRFNIASLFNTNNGIVNNFVIHNKNVLIGENYLGGLGVYNNGIIENGYTYGANVEASEGGSTHGYNRYVGGIVAENKASGSIKNVYTNITTTTKHDKIGRNFGSIVGKNDGLVENAYSYSTGKVNVDPQGGPGIGTNNGIVKNSFYYSMDDENNEYNKKFRGLIDLYAPNIINPIINKQNKFEVDKFLLKNYYPQIKFDGYMPEQELVPLPEQDKLRDVDVVGGTRTSLDDEKQNATVEVIVKNPNEYKVESISIGGTVTEVKSQVNKDGFSTVTLDVKADKLFVDEYSVSTVVYFNGNFYDSVMYQSGEREIFIGLYEKLLYPQQLSSLNPKFNYLMMNNITLSGNSFDISEEYVGNFDGNNFTLSDITNTSYNIFSSMNEGSIKNINFSNIKLGNNNMNNPSEVGIVGTSLNGIYENVTLNKVHLTGGINTGSLIGTSTNDSLVNIGIGNTNIKLKPGTGDSIGVGSLIGNANNINISNYYVQNIKINSDLNTFKSVGGLIGILNGGNVLDGYVSNIDINLPLGVNVGGIVGSVLSGSSNISNMYAYGFIKAENYVAALIGNNNSHDLSLNKILSLYNITSTSPINSPLINGIVENDMFINIFNSNISLVNGGNTPNDNITTISIKDFNKVDTYYSTIGFGDLYTYEGIENLKLPLVYNKDKSELIKGQELIEIVYNDFYLESYKVVKQTNQGITIQYDMSNPKKNKIDEFLIKDLRIVNNLRVINQEEQIYEQDYIPLKYFDFYNLIAINYTLGSNKETLSLNSFIDVALYREIWNVDSYNSLITRPGENAIIMDDLDFRNRIIEPNLVLNRLISHGKTISNINSDKQLYSEVNYVSGINYSDSVINNYYIFNKINNLMENIKFNNVTIDATGIQSDNSTDKGVSSVGSFDRDAIVRKIEFNNSIVVSKQNNNALLLGMSKGSNVKIDDIIIKGSRINLPTTSRSYNGGVIGRSNNGLESISNIKIDGFTITNGYRGIGGIAGGIHDSKGSITNSSISNFTINKGQNNASGGIIGILQSTYPEAIISDTFVESFNVTSTGEKIGGLIGDFNHTRDPFKFFNVGISNSNITSTKSYVGGLIGDKYNGNFILENAYVDNVNVTGHNNVGGVMGRDYYGSPIINNLFINANIVGNGNVGLFSGYSWYATMNNIILTGNINVKNDMATIFGSVGASGVEASNLIVAPGIIETPRSFVIQKGGNYSRFRTNYIYGESQIITNGFTTILEDIANTIIPENSKFQIVNRHMMNNPGFYNEKNYLFENWNFQNVSTFHFPQVANQKGVILPGQSITPIPNFTRKIQSEMFNIIDEKKSLPKIKAYSSGVDSINIDFEEYYQGLNVEISVGEKVIYSGPVNSKTISFIYDYKSSIKIKINNGNEEIIKEYKADEFINGVSIINHESYYIIDNKLYKGNNIINDNALHIYKNKVLLESEEIIDLSNSSTFKKVSNSILSESIRLFSSNNIDVFGTYSIYEGNIKNEVLIIDGEIIKYSEKIQKNQFIFGKYNDNKILSILEVNGKIRDVKNPIKIPEGFNNSDILELYSEGELVTLKYKDNKVILFDYQTGELLFENNVINNSSFIDMVSKNIKSVFLPSDQKQTTNLKYIEMTNFVNELENYSKVNNEGILKNENNLEKQYTISFDFDKEKYIIYNKNDFIDNKINEVQSIDEKDPQIISRFSNHENEKTDILNIGNFIFIIFACIIFIIFKNKNKMIN